MQILIYYDNRWRLLLKQFICWIFTVDRLCAQLECGLFQGCGPVIKMSQLRLQSSFHEHGSSPGALGFHKCGSSSGALFSWFRLHLLQLLFVVTHMLFVLVCLKLNGKLMKSSTQNQENIPNILSNLILVVFYKQRCYHEEISKKNNIQTISEKAVAGFAFTTWGPFIIPYNRIKKMAVWKTAFVSEHLDTDQFQLTKCFALVCVACCSIDNSS